MRRLVLLSLLCAVALGGTIAPELEEILERAESDTLIAVIVHTALQADLGRLANAGYDEKVAYLQFVADEAQRGILAFLETTDATNIRSFWLESKIALSARPDVIRALAAREDVDFIVDDFTVTLDASVLSGECDAPGWNISKVKADSCWAKGIDGTGVVVGNVDTGVQVSHPAFHGRWRWTNGWFDAVEGRTAPYDDHGHGTHTMGSICGGDGRGPDVDDIGVAPGATFICAKAFNSQGAGQVSWISACLDWMAGTGRPQVCSNSWGTDDRTGTYWFGSFNNLRSLGIVCVAAIGNAGPGTSTSCPPGSYPIVMGVGATTRSDFAAWFSSRGPAPNQPPWNQTQYWPRPDWNLTNPAISAPGESIYSALPGSRYGLMRGTSMACPHVAGGAALLLQKRPSLTHDQIFMLLTEWADRPGSGSWPNNELGWGRMNCKAALDRASSSTRPDLALKRVCVSNDGNRNGRLDPGERCQLVAYLFNWSNVAATNVTGTLRLSDPYITLIDSTADFGRIAGEDSASNGSNPFVVGAAASCPRGHTAELVLHLVCSETSFVTSFRLTVGRTGKLLLDHDTGYCKLTVSCIGAIGYDRPPGLDAGAGFAYPKTGASQLFYASLALGDSTGYVADRYYGQPNSAGPNQDLVTLDSLLPVLPAEAGDEHFSCCYSDAGHPQTKGIEVVQSSYQTAMPGYDDFVVMTFDIKNNGDSAVSGLYAGVFADFDIGMASINICSTDASRRFAFMRQSSTPNPTVGVKLLFPYEAANLAAVENARYVYPDSGMTDNMKWRFLNGTLGQSSSHRAHDWAVCVSAGPFDLAVGESRLLAVAFVGGANAAVARAHADSAQSWYDRNVGLSEPESRTRPVTDARRMLPAVKPNPFRNRTDISFQLAQPGRVRVSVADVAGREVECLRDEIMPAGGHRLTWVGRGLARGVYLLRVRTAESESRVKVLKF